MIYVISDTHFDHQKMLEYCDRPQGFSDKIGINLLGLKPDDILIHLGDICFCNDFDAHCKYIMPIQCKKWLIKGNHDHKTSSWYLDHGWDFVCKEFKGSYYGKEIIFSHKPVDTSIINIHGHFHNSKADRWEKELIKFINRNHKLIALEEVNYKPIKLQEILSNSKYNTINKIRQCNIKKENNVRKKDAKEN